MVSCSVKIPQQLAVAVRRVRACTGEEGRRRLATTAGGEQLENLYEFPGQTRLMGRDFPGQTRLMGRDFRGHLFTDSPHRRLVTVGKPMVLNESLVRSLQIGEVLNTALKPDARKTAILTIGVSWPSANERGGC